ncbi:DNA-directed RNA polymerase [Puccinia sorghi]|uniref:DNA-directed RNA polymerase n=1 Tax=Puccinia sorghi TaxID=27349 RepID=A0A0L6UWQ3_9BASI|nr:DNA-directed RNA polymerase [Puccinia sorghi]
MAMSGSRCVAYVAGLQKGSERPQYSYHNMESEDQVESFWLGGSWVVGKLPGCGNGGQTSRTALIDWSLVEPSDCQGGSSRVYWTLHCTGELKPSRSIHELNQKHLKLIKLANKAVHQAASCSLNHTLRKLWKNKLKNHSSQQQAIHGDNFNWTIHQHFQVGALVMRGSLETSKITQRPHVTTISSSKNLILARCQFFALRSDRSQIAGHH